MAIISYSPLETEVYTKFQTDVLNHKMKYSYAATVSKFGFSNNIQLEEFIIRTLLGFRMETIESASRPIPFVPDVVTKELIAHCIANANDLNCIFTHKTLYILEEKLADRAFRGYRLANMPVHHQSYR